MHDSAGVVPISESFRIKKGCYAKKNSMFVCAAGFAYFTSLWHYPKYKRTKQCGDPNCDNYTAGGRHNGPCGGNACTRAD
ncbi:MAG: hypothetical protein J6Z46_09140 [Lachnospiraceae bacterium]|nr:hypothetical protein [Lachnospiraceae bacterium]